MQVLRFVVDAFKAEKYNQNKTLFLFGSYTIGKERLFLEAARILQQKVCSICQEAPFLVPPHILMAHLMHFGCAQRVNTVAYEGIACKTLSDVSRRVHALQAAMSLIRVRKGTS